MKFKVGDRVRLTEFGVKLAPDDGNEYPGMTVGDEGVVVRVDEDDYWLGYKVKFDKADREYWFQEDVLELVLPSGTSGTSIVEELYNIFGALKNIDDADRAITTAVWIEKHVNLGMAMMYLRETVEVGNCGKV